MYCASTMGAHRVWGVSCCFLPFSALRKQLCGLKEAAADMPLTFT